MKEKDNQLELARSKLNAVQAQTYSSEGTLTSLEEALTDRDKQGRDSMPIPEFPLCRVGVVGEDTFEMYLRLDTDT